jgi:hypothetical protein
VGCAGSNSSIAVPSAEATNARPIGEYRSKLPSELSFWLGLPFVLRRDRQSIYAACGVCLLVSILYFGAENVMHALAERDALLSPLIAAWIPVAVFGVAGVLSYQDV